MLRADPDTSDKRHHWHCQSKLSQVSGIPEGRIVYRGVGGMRLPKCFYEQNDKGVMGGAERAFMSTTTSRDVAIYVRVRLRLERCFSCDAARVPRYVSNAHLPSCACMRAVCACTRARVLGACVCALCNESPVLYAAVCALRLAFTRRRSRRGSACVSF